MGNREAELRYQKILEKREQNIKKNIAQGRPLDLSDVTTAIDMKGGTVKNVKDLPIETPNIVRNAKGFSNVMSKLGLGGAALGAALIAQKANAGDLKGAAVEALDTVSDYIPGVSTAKMFAPESVGNADYDPNDPEQVKRFEEIRRRVYGLDK